MTSRLSWIVLLLVGCAGVAEPRAVEVAASRPGLALALEVEGDRHVHVVAAERDIDCARCGGREETWSHVDDLQGFARWWTRRTWQNVLVEADVEQLVWFSCAPTPPRATAARR